MLDGAHGPQNRIELKVFRNLAAAAHAGGVHNHELVPELIIIGRDGVASGASNGSDDIPLLPQQRICKGRFSHVRPPDNGDVRKVRVVIVRSGIGRKDADNLVQKVTGAGAVGGRYAPDLPQPKGVEVIGIVHLFAAVHLVDAHHHGLFAAAQKVRDLRIVVRDAGGGFAHE